MLIQGKEDSPWQTSRSHFDGEGANFASQTTNVEAAMSIPLRVTSYLEHRGVRYEVCAHAYSRTSAQTARQAHLPPHLLA